MGVSSDIHTNIQLSEIEKAVGEESYQILLLKVGLHMTFDEISRELGETPSKIKRIYYSAYEKAREYVKRGDMNEKVDNEIQKNFLTTIIQLLKLIASLT